MPTPTWHHQSQRSPLVQQPAFCFFAKGEGLRAPRLSARCRLLLSYLHIPPPGVARHPIKRGALDSLLARRDTRREAAEHGGLGRRVFRVLGVLLDKRRPIPRLRLSSPHTTPPHRVSSERVREREDRATDIAPLPFFSASSSAVTSVHFFVLFLVQPHPSSLSDDGSVIIRVTFTPTDPNGTSRRRLPCASAARTCACSLARGRFGPRGCHRRG